MPKMARLGDPISHGGYIIEASHNAYCNEQRIARVGDAVNCHIHGTQTIESGSDDTFCNTKRVARVGDLISCGATISDGSPDTYVNG